MLNDDYGSWFMEALLVVALLMINVAIQAALNPPGSVLQEPNNATTSPNALWQVAGNITLPNATLPNAIWQATGFGTLPDDTLPNATNVGQSIMSSVNPGRYEEFYRANNLSIIFSMLAIEILLMRCFSDNWLLDIIPIFLTSMSVVAMVDSYTASVFVSGNSYRETKLVSLSSTIILYIPAFVPHSRRFYFVPIWLVKKMKTQHHLLGIGSCVKTSNLKDGAEASQSETACKELKSLYLQYMFL